MKESTIEKHDKVRRVYNTISENSNGKYSVKELFRKTKSYIKSIYDIDYSERTIRDIIYGV